MRVHSLVSNFLQKKALKRKIKTYQMLIEAKKRKGLENLVVSIV